MRFIIASLILCIVNTNAYCLYIDSWMGFYAVKLSEDLIVTGNGTFLPTRIDVLRSVSILNSGTIGSDLYINGDNRVYVKNSGTINGTFYVAPDARVIQVVQSNDDITNLTVKDITNPESDGNFNILVRDAMDVSLTNVFGIAANADKLILDNSVLLLNSAIRPRIIDAGPRAIELVGDVVLKLDSVDSLDYSLPILRNVSETGNLRFDIGDLNPLYRVATYVDDGDLYMSIVRETDYGRIFQNDVGNFLNDLRRDMPNDKLLRAMDNAPDMNTINSIMNTSMRLHPLNLMRPVRRMHMLDALDGWRYSDVVDIDSATDIIFSDTSLLGRVNVSMVGDVSNNLHAAVGGYIGALAVTDDINDFYGGMYGANMMLHFDDWMVIGNLAGGIAVTYFDTGPVFDGNATVFNPSGMSGYAAMDIGARLYHQYDLTIVPFAGLVANYASVLNDADTVTLANVGVELNLSEYDFDILYDYGLRGSVLTDGAYHVGVYGKFSAPDDDIGAQINAAIIHDEFGFGYKISISTNIAF